MTRIAIKLMAYTFVRTSELIQAKWCEFDINANEWRIPAERMKMNSPHIVPLATQSIELLETLKNITGDTDYLFPHLNNHNRTMRVRFFIAARFFIVFTFFCTTFLN